ncbi:hypothetical protein BCL90_3037 [Pedobacter alluvionis]|uniref:Uncharacterized protein n=1 Tax=Pedobacter alluvionis TaxID=475253 RepID=A0A497XZ33_9SPHI|nr:hypothetical protein BCL90_3037 [Pedobacter alluvionis]
MNSQIALKLDFFNIWKCKEEAFGSLQSRFCCNKSRKNFWFPRQSCLFNRGCCKEMQTNWLLTNTLFLNPTGANIPILHRNKADGGTTVPMKNWLSFSNYNAWIGEKSSFLAMCIFKLDFSWIKNVHQFVKANDILLCSYLFR